MAAASSTGTSSFPRRRHPAPARMNPAARIIILQKRKGFGRNSLHAKWLTTSVMIFSRY